MTTYVGIALGGVMLTLLQIGFQPSNKVQETALKIELRAMLTKCIETNGPDCDVIERVMNKTN